jgi:hypothetical protein
VPAKCDCRFCGWSYLICCIFLSRDHLLGADTMSVLFLPLHPARSMWNRGLKASKNLSCL